MLRALCFEAEFGGHFLGETSVGESHDWVLFELELEGMLDVEQRELFFCGLERRFKRLHTSGDFGLFPFVLDVGG